MSNLLYNKKCAYTIHHLIIASSSKNSYKLVHDYYKLPYSLYDPFKLPYSLYDPFKGNVGNKTIPLFDHFTI